MTTNWLVGPTLAALAATTVLLSSAPPAHAAGAGLAAPPQVAQQKRNVSCEMAFTMKGWSAIVSKAEGKGVVTCDNGQRADVVLTVTGGGLTFGKTEVEDGKGVFTGVTDINDIFGAYGQAEAAAGAVESVSAQALTKGNVGLAITTKGKGWSLGVSGARFSIARAK
jgi:hypothetical protein